MNLAIIVRPEKPLLHSQGYKLLSRHRPKGASHRLELWSCEKGSLKPLHRLKVNQARKIKEAHHRHRGKAACKFERSPPSRVSDRDLRQRDLRLSERRRGSVEQQTEGAAAHPNESDGEADAKDNFQDVKFLLATKE
jgi:hypothetical protein